ncbi:hypothetical protein THRCLA_07876 [Thraustotheca clavata]|uniref:Uncharacterized protein n=1 Tax=Thraustotheca clavata TaxID=74557 RepID=A0A1V9ZBS9_9STRA|nr:hypothetical protein THRCLA_07876 [Thraustotheca clavata]
MSKDNVEGVVQKLVRQVLHDEERDYLILREVIALNLLIQTLIPVDLWHFGILLEWNLTSPSPDGQFSIENLIKFVRTCSQEEKDMQHPTPTYFKHVKEAKSLFATWQVITHNIQQDKGFERIVSWITAILRENALIDHQIQSIGDCDYIHIECIRHFEVVFNWNQVPWIQAIEFQANANGFTVIEFFLPLPSIIDFIREFLRAWVDQLERYKIVNREKT